MKKEYFLSQDLATKCLIMYESTLFECVINYPISYKENGFYKSKLEIKLENSCAINRQYYYTETDVNSYFPIYWKIINIEKLKQNN